MRTLTAGTLYLRTSPKACLERIQERNRKEELDMGLEYLQLLHDKYDEAFMGCSAIHGVSGDADAEDVGQMALNIMYVIYNQQINIS